MHTNEELELLYNSTFKSISTLLNKNSYSEKSIIKIILPLCINKKLTFFHNNTYDFELISNVFRFYEEKLKDSFFNNKPKFNLFFKNYLLVIELFTILCDFFSQEKEKRLLINPIFQILKESKSLLKFLIPLAQKELKIINNIIGEQLYYFSHVNYIETKGKTTNYLLEQYLLECQKIFHGYELSLSTNFGDNPYKNKKDEKMIFLNNLTFILLEMIHKLDFYKLDKNIFDNEYFHKIIDFFIPISFINHNTKINNKNSFYKILLEEFNLTAKYLKSEKNYDIITKKIKILSLNTDEYKQLIDIISSLK